MDGAGYGGGGATLAQKNDLARIGARIEEQVKAVRVQVVRLSGIGDRVYGARPSGDKEATGFPPSVGSVPGIDTGITALESAVGSLAEVVSRLETL